MGNRSLARGLQDGLHDPRPPHLLPIIHLCFRIFVSKEIPRQEIGNQSFGQSLPLEVNVCLLHIVSTAALSLPPRTRSGALANTLHQATNGKPPRVFQFVIFVWISAARFVPVKITGAGARSKLGTMQRSKAVVAMMSEPSLPLWLRCSYICNLYYTLHRPFLHNLNGYKHISVCAGLVRLHILKTGPLHRRPNETLSWCTSSRGLNLFLLCRFLAQERLTKREKLANVSFTYVCVRQR